MAREIDSKEFTAEVLEGSGSALIDFWAPWCGPCRMLGPIIDNLSHKYDGKVLVAKVNVDNSPDLAAKFGISTIPTILFFKDGKMIHSAVGVMPEAEFDTMIKEKLL
ncbi:MAG: thioredoxin [Candidatus Rifleibacteriota bacterium]